MSDLEPLPIAPENQAAVLRLNNAHATELSFLDPPLLAALIGGAFHARQVGRAEAFLIALDQDAAYDSPNFTWFRDRFPRFVYLDRLAVDPANRGRGLARLLHADLARQAAAAGHDLLACEVNLHPPNPASDALHASLGFTEVGTAAIHGGRKTVRYLARRIRPA